MTYWITWSGDGVAVSTEADVDAALDRIAAGPGARLVDVFTEPKDGSGMQLVFGHPDRAMVMYADAEVSGWAVDPSLSAWPSEVDYDHGSIEPERTRVTPAQARQAVREYVATGQRPTCVQWIEAD